MICRNCGLQNPTGFAYCGSCGSPLNGGDYVDQHGPAGSDETVVVPAIQSRAAERSRAQAVPLEPRAPEPAPVDPRTSPEVTPRRQSLVCRNCGRANMPSRSVCYQCGRRLIVPPDLRLQRSRYRDGGGARLTTIASSALLVLLALGAGGVLFGAVLLGAMPPATPTPFGPTEAVSPSLATMPIAVAPSVTPSVVPTVRITLAPASPPPASATPSQAPTSAAAASATAQATPTAADCAGSTVETEWLNLTRDDPRQRVADEGGAWCLHRAVLVPYFGHGTIRLLVDDEEVAEVVHRRSSDQTEYAVTFDEPVLVEPGSRLAYQYRCAADDCAAAIQVGYDELGPP